jgi:PilZ domain
MSEGGTVNQPDSSVENPADRRRELRYPTDATVLVRRMSGAIIQANAMDISASGMRLYLQQQPCPLCLDEEVTVEVQLREPTEKPFSAWGLGRVAHVDRGGVGIQLYGGEFHPLPSGVET